MTNRELSGESNLFVKSLGDLKTAFEATLATPRWLAVAYLVALILAEAVTTLLEPRLGMILHGLILVTLLIHAALIDRGAQQKFLLALALAPLIRLVSLSMPLPQFPFTYWYLIVGAPLLIAAIVAARLNHMSRGMLGLKLRGLPWQLVIGATGIVLGLIEYLILRPEPLVSELSWQAILLPAIILLVFTGFLEEFIFRGVMQYTSLRNLGRFGLFYVAAIFAVLHIGYRSVFDVVFVFIVALFFGYAVLRTGSILGATLSHGITNITLFLIFPFLIASPTPLISSPEGIEAPQGIAAPAQMTPTPEIVGPVLWAPAPQKVLTTTPIIPGPTQTPSPTIPTPTQTLAPTETPVPPTPTEAPQTCKPPAGWVTYVVRRGDTLWSISQAYGISVTRLRSANCIKAGQGISPGTTIYVPYVPPTLPPPPPSATPFPTATASPLPTIAIPTATVPPPPTATETPLPATPTTAPTEPPPTAEIPTSTPITPPPTATDIPPSATLTSEPESTPST